MDLYCECVSGQNATFSSQLVARPLEQKIRM